jgi:hypothetical protein
LCNFAVSNLFWQRIRSVIDIGIKTVLNQLGRNLGRVLFLQGKEYDRLDWINDFANALDTHVGHSDRDDENVSGGEPERPVQDNRYSGLLLGPSNSSPFSSKVLGNYCNKALHASQNGAMDDNWTTWWFIGVDGLFCRTVFQIESFW